MSKQAIVVRADLNLSSGKLAAQSSHAAVSSALLCKTKKKNWFNEWFESGQKKVVLKAKSLEELRQLKKKADSLGIPNSLIKDAGFTELFPGTTTCIGIGPAPDEKIDKIVGSLPLL